MDRGPFSLLSLTSKKGQKPLLANRAVLIWRQAQK